MRIVSFLPAATEMIYLLGLGDHLVGRSHECDYPAQVRDKPIIVDCALDLSTMSMAEIDTAVSRRLSSGRSLYHVHEARLRIAAPDLLLTQNLCQVCGPAGNEVSEVLRAMASAPKVIWQNPRSFEEVVETVRALGEETGTEEIAKTWAASATSQVQRISTMSSALRRVRVSFLEWVDPVYCGGHWVPQMLEWAGAEDRNSRIGTDSVRIPWEQVLDYQPEVIIAAPCGFNTRKALEQAQLLQSRPGWNDLPAVRHGKVYAVDANSYFARPGPRLVEGVALLAHLIHREYFDWAGPADAYAPVLSAAERRVAHH
jgi:iron complex transport system substrate-binding protein